MRATLIRKHIPAGSKVWNGFFRAEKRICQAPEEPGMYSLYQLHNDKEGHTGWQWVKEEEE